MNIFIYLNALGSLINSQYVVTAAHCIINYKYDKLVIIVGISNQNEKLTYSNTYYASSIVYHSNYKKDFAAFGYDIGSQTLQIIFLND